MVRKGLASSRLSVVKKPLGKALTRLTSPLKWDRKLAGWQKRRLHSVLAPAQWCNYWREKVHTVWRLCQRLASFSPSLCAPKTTSPSLLSMEHAHPVQSQPPLHSSASPLTTCSPWRTTQPSDTFVIHIYLHWSPFCFTDQEQGIGCRNLISLKQRTQWGWLDDHNFQMSARIKRFDYNLPERWLQGLVHIQIQRRGKGYQCLSPSLPS